jgi:hypothetical protein
MTNGNNNAITYNKHETDISIAQTAAIVLIEKFKEQDRKIEMLELKVKQLSKEIERIRFYLLNFLLLLF